MEGLSGGGVAEGEEAAAVAEVCERLLRDDAERVPAPRGVGVPIDGCLVVAVGFGERGNRGGESVLLIRSVGFAAGGEPVGDLGVVGGEGGAHEPSDVEAALQARCGFNLGEESRGVVVLLNCGESAAQLLAQFEGTARAAQAPERGRMDLRTYGVGAQILRECGVHKMQLMGQPRRMPSMAGYGLEITGYIPKE